MANGEFDPQKIEEFLKKLRENKNTWKIGVMIFLGVVGIVFIKSMVYTIQPEQEGVVQRFGKFVAITGPGLHFKAPWGIDHVTKVRTSYIFKQEFGYQTRQPGVRTEYARGGGERSDEISLMLTGDLNIADVEWSVQYRISEPEKFLFNVRDPIGTLRDASESTMRLIVGDRSVDELLTSGR